MIGVQPPPLKHRGHLNRRGRRLRRRYWARRAAYIEEMLDHAAAGYPADLIEPNPFNLPREP